ncbi:MAG: lysophospholipid acyltransferase family protein [Chloroflexia bacterium]
MQAMKFPENAHGWSYSVPAGLARSTLQAAAFGVLDLLAPAQVDGAEVFDHLPCPVLLAANHTSHLDTLALLRALPRHFRKHVAVAAAGDYFFANPWSGAAVTLCLNAFPFARASSAGAVRAGLEYCAGLLDSGWSVLLFPEGTRSLTGDIGRFRSGVGMLAAHTGAPVVPAYLHGLHRVLPKGQSIPRPGPVAVRFGPPLRFSPGTPHAQASRAIEDAVRSLSIAYAPARQTPYLSVRI